MLRGRWRCGSIADADAGCVRMGYRTEAAARRGASIVDPGSGGAPIGYRNTWTLGRVCVGSRVRRLGWASATVVGICTRRVTRTGAGLGGGAAPRLSGLGPRA